VCAQRASLKGVESSTQLWDERRDALESAGARIIVVPSADHKVNIYDALSALRGLGVRSVMVEGGASVIATFMKLKDPDGKPMVDMHIVTVAPKVIGMSGVKATDPGAEPPHLEPIDAEIFGKDAVFASRLLKAASS